MVIKNVRKLASRIAIATSLGLVVTAVAIGQQQQPTIGKTYAESREGQKPPVPKAKEGAPNVIWILLDDVGFGAVSAFGGPVPTPTFDALADGGLRYTNFHTTGICSPTRAALLTGRNHHKVGMGAFPHDFMSAEFPGYTGRLQPKDGTVAEYLREAGYSTYALGKWHLTPDAEITDLGPFDRWPSGKGFDHFLGFLGGAEDQYKPRLVEDTNSVKPDGRHLNAQLTDKAISYIDRQAKIAPDRPFFLYLAPGAGHSPHQVDQPWLDKYKGKFDAGWDVVREQILARQKKLGVVPQDAKLPPRDPRVPAWNSLSADQKKINARFMEGYAAFVEYTDYEIGRLVDHLRKTGKLENTAIFVVVGDNGASKEGGPNGSLYSELTPLTKDDKGQVAELLSRFDDIGTARSYTNYPIGWAQTLNTPFRQWKADANSEGGTRNPLIAYWPKGLPKGEVRGQYGHVIDLLPTTLEITGAKLPETLRGVKQEPIQGTSLGYSFKDKNAASRHTTQYSLIFGSGGIVKDGWKASFNYRPDYLDIFQTFPVPTKLENNAGKEKWELFNLNADFNERTDLAKSNPAKLKELQAAFDAEAQANGLYPILNWSDVATKAREAFASGAIRTPVVPETPRPASGSGQ